MKAGGTLYDSDSQQGCREEMPPNIELTPIFVNVTQFGILSSARVPPNIISPIRFREPKKGFKNCFKERE